jgi:dihydroxyacetone kinase
MELGLGIHGEPGVKRTRLLPADELSEVLLTEILKGENFGDERRVVVMINNLGATTEMELAILARHVVPSLEKRGFTVERLYAGTFLSSLDMAGISISVLSLNGGWLRWLDAPTTAPSWPNVLKQRPRSTSSPITTNVVAPVKAAAAGSTRSETGAKLRRAIKAACQALIEAEPKLTEMDRITGDADLGVSMKRAATAIEQNLEAYPLEDVSATVKALGQTLRQELGGSSGPLYGVLFLRCGSVLEQKGATSLAQWTEAVAAGSRAISELGGAKPGDRTMLDALDPFVRSLNSSGANASRDILLSAVEAAEKGAEASATMRPHLGRSSYLGDRAIGHPDPGAMAVAIWLRAVCEALFAS